MVLVIKTVMLLLPEAIASPPFPITIILSWTEVTASSLDFLSESPLPLVYLHIHSKYIAFLKHKHEYATSLFKNPSHWPQDKVHTV